MFRGISQPALDAKGRLAIPARYREHISSLCDGRLIVTIDRDGCLLLYPAPEWENIEQGLLELPNLDPRVKALLRIMVGHAADCEMDGQGRVNVPPLLRDYAGLEKKAVLVGQGNKFEIWSEAAWSEQQASWINEGSTPEMAAVLAQVSI